MFRTTLSFVLTTIALSITLVHGIVVPRDINPADRYCPWCWDQVPVVTDPSFCHVVIQAPNDISKGTVGENMDGTMAILSGDLKQLYAWSRINFAATYGVASQGSVDIDTNYPGLRQFGNPWSASVTMSARNTSVTFQVADRQGQRSVHAILEQPSILFINCGY